MRTYCYLLCTASLLCKAQPIYVDSSAAGANNGTSWANAYTSLASALSGSTAGKEIWVAKGTYLTPVNVPFPVRYDVELYGGFSGNETSLTARDWKANPTILKGNDSHVIHVSDQSTHPAVIDGFIITGGTAGASSVLKNGAGIYINATRPVLRNLVIRGNTAAQRGGGIYGLHSAPLMSNVLLSQNMAGEGGGAPFTGTFIAGTVKHYPYMFNCTLNANSAAAGGGLYGDACNIELVNSVISGNIASQHGGGAVYSDVGGQEKLLYNVLVAQNVAYHAGGIYLDNSDMNFVNMTLSGNQSTGSSAGGMYCKLSEVDFYNCILYGNISSTISPVKYNVNTENSTLAYRNCLVQDASAQGLFGRPFFADSVAGDYRLTDSSDAINYGDLSFYTSTVTVDAAGHPRVKDNVIDAGAFEYMAPGDTVSTADFSLRGFAVYPNPAGQSLSVHIDGGCSDCSFDILDMQGRALPVATHATSEGLTADVSKLPAGIYFARIIYKGVVCRKFVLSR